jgi:O-antigen ligase
MVVISVITVYKCYSKAGWITLVAILFVWFLLRKKIIQTILIPVIVAIILFVNPFAKDFQKTFDNEINYFIHGSNTKEMVFRGRLNRWEMGMNDFNSLPIINKLFGAQKSISYPENDYLRVLWGNGIIGFIAFLILLWLIGYLLIRKYVKNKDPVVIMGILIFIMYLLSSIGTSPMLSPTFQWFMWGIIGFVLASHKIAVGLSDQRSSYSSLQLNQNVGRIGINAGQ